MSCIYILYFFVFVFGFWDKLVFFAYEVCQRKYCNYAKIRPPTFYTFPTIPKSGFFMCGCKSISLCTLTSHDLLGRLGFAPTGLIGNPAKLTVSITFGYASWPSLMKFNKKENNLWKISTCSCQPFRYHRVWKAGIHNRWPILMEFATSVAWLSFLDSLRLFTS